MPRKRKAQRAPEPEPKGYNGWTNYETWNVNLWMGNDPGSDEYYREVAQEVWDGREVKESWERTLGSSQTDEERAANRLAERLKDEYETAMHDWLDESKRTGSVWADLLGAALGEVNWHEIAEHMIADLE